MNVIPTTRTYSLLQQREACTTTELDVMHRLAFSTDAEVRYALCWNAALPEPIRALLFADAHPWVRIAAASAPAATADYLTRLLDDEHPDARAQAQMVASWTEDVRSASRARLAAGMLAL